MLYYWPAYTQCRGRLVTVAGVCRRLSSVGVIRRRLLSVTLPAGEPTGRRGRGRSGSRHSTAGQYGYVTYFPSGWHLVSMDRMRKAHTPVFRTVIHYSPGYTMRFFAP